MWVKTPQSINQTLHNWLWTVSWERWGGVECRNVTKVHMRFCTQTHRYTHVCKDKDTQAVYCAALRLYAGWHTRFDASGADRISLLEKKKRHLHGNSFCSLLVVTSVMTSSRHHPTTWIRDTCWCVSPRPSIKTRKKKRRKSFAKRDNNMQHVHEMIDRTRHLVSEVLLKSSLLHFYFSDDF